MIFQRGNQLDSARWARDPGMEAWDYAHCLPYFERMEACTPRGRTPTRRPPVSCTSSAARAWTPLFEPLPRGREADRATARSRRERPPPAELR